MNAHYEDALKNLISKMQTTGGVYNYDLVKKAFSICIEAHSGQKRISGEEYYNHPYQVALILVDLGMDSKSIAAALLHDVVEDTGYTLQYIEEQIY